jgi:hypothetical protein
MQKIYNTDNLAALPEHQRKMMNGWERNKSYTASNGKEYPNLLSNLEVKILQYLDEVEQYDMNLVEAPAPFTVHYVNQKLTEMRISVSYRLIIKCVYKDRAKKIRAVILLYHFPVLHVSEGKKHAGQTRVIGEKFLNLKRASGKMAGWHN